MRADVSAGAAAGSATGAELEVLDVGDWPVTAADCARVVDAVAAGRAPVLAEDRNSTCHVLDWPDAAGGPRAVVVKVPRAGPQRTNADATFAGEAAVLARLPAAGIANASELVARVTAAGRHYLLLAHREGEHPDPAAQPLAARHLAALFESLARMDERGLVHYDLKPANLLLAGDAVAFLDFEFARFHRHADAFTAARRALCDDFNVAPNPHFPAHTNVANFEFRTLYRYCEGLRAVDARAAERFFRDYLAARARYHAQRARHLEGLAVADAARLGATAALPIAEARRRLVAAAAHERLLGRLLAMPPADVVATEWALVAFRHDVFERREARARLLRREIRAATDRARAAVPAWRRSHAEAVAWTVEKVARSRVPGQDVPSVDFGGDADAPVPRAATSSRSRAAASS